MAIFHSYVKLPEGNYSIYSPHENMVLDVLDGCWYLRAETGGIRPGTCTPTEDVLIAEWLQIVDSWVSWVVFSNFNFTWVCPKMGETILL